MWTKKNSRGYHFWSFRIFAFDTGYDFYLKLNHQYLEGNFLQINFWSRQKIKLEKSVSNCFQMNNHNSRVHTRVFQNPFLLIEPGFPLSFVYLDRFWWNIHQNISWTIFLILNYYKKKSGDRTVLFFKKPKRERRIIFRILEPLEIRSS